ncbi:hypothetical protein GTU79_08870 [Sodalis ligni]|uniref:hypothetical protein n=1 Tax=Sodalis ligni TaxID=2697027 RepID=UPI00193FEB34|nr:hypothetical protein [Sodalis ligni]QWA12781.1 hypothetical protein GTU79_08870 [Sodalis ligni]
MKHENKGTPANPGQLEQVKHRKIITWIMARLLMTRPCKVDFTVMDRPQKGSSAKNQYCMRPSATK